MAPFEERLAQSFASLLSRLFYVLLLSAELLVYFKC